MISLPANVAANGPLAMTLMLLAIVLLAPVEATLAAVASSN